MLWGFTHDNSVASCWVSTFRKVQPGSMEELMSHAEDFEPVRVGSRYEYIPTFPAFLHPLIVDLEMKLGLWGSLPKDRAIGFIWQHLLENICSYWLFPLARFTSFNPLLMFPKVECPLKIISHKLLV